MQYWYCYLQNIARAYPHRSTAEHHCPAKTAHPQQGELARFFAADTHKASKRRLFAFTWVLWGSTCSWVANTPGYGQRFAQCLLSVMPPAHWKVPAAGYSLQTQNVTTRWERRLTKPMPAVLVTETAFNHRESDWAQKACFCLQTRWRKKPTHQPKSIISNKRQTDRTGKNISVIGKEITHCGWGIPSNSNHTCDIHQLCAG